MIIVLEKRGTSRNSFRTSSKGEGESNLVDGINFAVFPRRRQREKRQNAGLTVRGNEFGDDPSFAATVLKSPRRRNFIKFGGQGATSTAPNGPRSVPKPSSVHPVIILWTFHPLSPRWPASASSSSSYGEYRSVPSD